MSAIQAIWPDTFLAVVTRKTYNTTIEYANITYACVNGGRANVQERLGLEDDGDAISSKALLCIRTNSVYANMNYLFESGRRVPQLFVRIRTNSQGLINNYHHRWLLVAEQTS